MCPREALCVGTAGCERELYVSAWDCECDSQGSLEARGLGVGGSVRPLAAGQRGVRDLGDLVSSSANPSLPSPRVIPLPLPPPPPTHPPKMLPWKILSINGPALSSPRAQNWDPPPQLTANVHAGHPLQTEGRVQLGAPHDTHR